MPSIYRFRQKSVARRLGNDAIIWIDPTKIDFHVGNLLSLEPKFLSTPFMKMKYELKNRSYRMILKRSFIISREDFRLGERIEDTVTYQLVKDYVRNKNDFRNSTWYKSLLNEMNSTGVANYKKQRFFDVDDLDSFFISYVSPIYESFKTSGFDCKITVLDSKCYVDRSGQLIKGAAGRHRLAFAKVLNLDRFPLVIRGVHEDWYLDRIGTKLDIPKLREELKAIGARYS